MQKISKREHQTMIEAYRKFDEFNRLVKYKINEEENLITREGIEELRTLYLRFYTLLQELDSCAKNYEKEKKKIQGVLNKNIRKMNSELRKNPIIN
ncbi:hypothetical protein [Flavobacterium cerinum]|uniref:Uncharacterized protein n=1 Tax=Flavobacterium cerinum TaxID=2502784 RepID=A0A444GLQ3_9FLAO|nr:hypothetical protein [Flavobacterium cerinum]RWW91949.1 hypothetical protein EPI11_17125 [Flavobacterium cerinum]